MAAVGVAAVAACGPSDYPLGVQPVRMPRPANARLHDAVQQNRACEGCHEEIAEEWRGSLHARANTEPSYRRAFDIEPMPFCRACHAPEAVPNEEPPTDVSELGVGCVSCHITDRGVLAAPLSIDGGRASRSAEAPHEVIRSQDFASAQACRACHEFRFPTAFGQHSSAFMQTTYREHASSPSRERSCASCHMPKSKAGHRHHGFGASRDEAMLRDALSIEAERRGDTVVAIRLSPRTLGHAFPTGDLFRRLEVLVEAIGPDMSLAASDRVHLARHWKVPRHGVGRVLERDDRVFYEPRVVLLELGPEAAGLSISWRVAYQRVAHPSHIDDASTELDGEVILDQGILRPALTPLE